MWREFEQWITPSLYTNKNIPLKFYIDFVSQTREKNRSIQWMWSLRKKLRYKLFSDFTCNNNDNDHDNDNNHHHYNNKSADSSMNCSVMIIIMLMMTGWNRPFPSCLVPLFQSESRCLAFHIQMSFLSNVNKTHFYMKGCAPSLALKKRRTTTRK